MNKKQRTKMNKAKKSTRTTIKRSHTGIHIPNGITGQGTKTIIIAEEVALENDVPRFISSNRATGQINKLNKLKEFGLDEYNNEMREGNGGVRMY